MSVVKHFIDDSIKKAEIDEFLRNEFERAGYGGVSITKTPLGTHLVVYTMRPGMVIGRGGETIRELATVLEEKFQLPSPQISVAEIEIPELNAFVVASRIASALKRGVHYRRAGYWGLNQAMEAGALGAEIIISGKLRTDRARYEKFRTGYLPKSGEPPRKYIRKAELHVQLKPGILGVKVRLIPPEAKFPDQVQVQIIEEKFESDTEGEIVEEKVAAEKKVATPKVLPVEEEKKVELAAPIAEEKVVVKEKVAEPVVSPVEEKLVVEEKETEPTTPPAEKEAEVKEKVAKPVVLPVKKKVVAKEKISKPVVPPVEKKKTEKKKKPKSKVPPAKEKKGTKKKVTEKKAAKSKSSTAKEETVTEKKKAKSKASSTKKTKEAGK